MIAWFVPNTIVLPAMDHATFISNPTSHSNYINCTIYSRDDPSALIGSFKRAIKKYPKLRYKLKHIMGDIYYEMMSVEETINKFFVILDQNMLKN